MIDPTVRAARAADVDQLASLESEARAAMVGTRGGDRWLSDHQIYAWVDLIDVAGTAVVVAEIDGVVTGYLVLVIAAGRARIDSVYVTPGARELGFGDALLEAAIERARADGADTLDGEALPGDRQTKNLYERAGITARLITVSTRL